MDVTSENWNMMKKKSYNYKERNNNEQGRKTKLHRRAKLCYLLFTLPFPLTPSSILTGHKVQFAKSVSQLISLVRSTQNSDLETSE